MSTPDATGLISPSTLIPAQAIPNSATRSKPLRQRDDHGRFTKSDPPKVIYAVGKRWDRDLNPAGYDTALALGTSRPGGAS